MMLFKQGKPLHSKSEQLSVNKPSEEGLDSTYYFN
jgi:hypothetical protein